MQSSLDIKLRRAQRHIDELAGELNQFLQTEPYALEQVRSANGDLLWRVRIKNETPMEWSAIVGDAVHNLRATLDHLACKLVLVNGGQVSRSTQFPFNKTKTGIGKKLRSDLAGASPEARRFVRKLRPWGGGNLILTQINSLDNADKHRSNLVVGPANRSIQVTTSLPVSHGETQEAEPLELTESLRPANRQFPLADGDVVFRVPKDAPGGDTVTCTGAVLEPAFDEIPGVAGLPLIPTLSTMHGHVAKIVDIAGRRLL